MSSPLPRYSILVIYHYKMASIPESEIGGESCSSYVKGGGGGGHVYVELHFFARYLHITEMPKFTYY